MKINLGISVLHLRPFDLQGIAKGGPGVNVLSNRRAVNTPDRSACQDKAVYSANLCSPKVHRQCAALPMCTGSVLLSQGSGSR